MVLGYHFLLGFLLDLMVRLVLEVPVVLVHLVVLVLLPDH
jgi:hypothetical protein